MRNLHSPRIHPSRTATVRAASGNRRAWPAHPSAQLISDGVMAGYIHDISIRHGNGATERWRHRRRGERR